MSWKLFACFLALTILVLALTLGLARWSFERGFLDYVNALYRTRLQRVADDLALLYAARGNTWDGFTNEAFERALAPHQPPRRDPPPRGKAASDAGPSDDVPRDPRGPRTALFNTNGRQIAGPVLERHPDREVKHRVRLGSSEIGELRALVHRRVTSPIDTAFLRAQGRRSLVIGAIAILLAALVARLLSRALLAPIRRAMISVARLSAGDFTPRLPIAGEPDDDDELAHLARDLERLRGTLDAGRNARRRLLADVSHELRTPLTILSGEIAAMLDGMRTSDLAQLRSLDEEVARLRHLVDDLHELSLSDVGGLRYEFTLVQLDECVRDALEALRAKAESEGIGIELQCEAPICVHADAQRLRQLLTNLTTNATAYTDAPGWLVVTVSTTGSSARVSFDDTPPGVGDGNYERLFESLYREEASRDRRRGGAGLGLAICRIIVAAHEGRIRAGKSELGGLRIDIDLPTRRDSEAP